MDYETLGAKTTSNFSQPHSSVRLAKQTGSGFASYTSILTKFLTIGQQTNNTNNAPALKPKEVQKMKIEVLKYSSTDESILSFLHTLDGNNAISPLIVLVGSSYPVFANSTPVYCHYRLSVSLVFLLPFTFQ